MRVGRSRPDTKVKYRHYFIVIWQVLLNNATHCGSVILSLAGMAIKTHFPQATESESTGTPSTRVAEPLYSSPQS